MLQVSTITSDEQQEFRENTAVLTKSNLLFHFSESQLSRSREWRRCNTFECERKNDFTEVGQALYSHKPIETLSAIPWVLGNKLNLFLKQHIWKDKMDPLPNIATSGSEGDGSFRIVIKNKEIYATLLRSPQKHSSPWRKKEMCEKPESITRSIQKRQEKNP